MQPLITSSDQSGLTNNRADGKNTKRYRGFKNLRKNAGDLKNDHGNGKADAID